MPSAARSGGALSLRDIFAFGGFFAAGFFISVWREPLSPPALAPELGRRGAGAGAAQAAEPQQPVQARVVPVAVRPRPERAGAGALPALPPVWRQRAALRQAPE